MGEKKGLHTYGKPKCQPGEWLDYLMQVHELTEGGSEAEWIESDKRD